MVGGEGTVQEHFGVGNADPHQLLLFNVVPGHADALSLFIFSNCRVMKAGVVLLKRVLAVGLDNVADAQQIVGDVGGKPWDVWSKRDLFDVRVVHPFTVNVSAKAHGVLLVLEVALNGLEGLQDGAIVFAPRDDAAGFFEKLPRGGSSALFFLEFHAAAEIRVFARVLPAGKVPF